MEKRVLAIHSNELFFGKDAPNFYQFIANKRGIGDEMNKLQEQYKAEKENSSLLLQKTYSLAMSGLTKSELERYIEEFFVNPQALTTINFVKVMVMLDLLRQKGYEILVFTSYPVEIYQHPANFKQKIFGPNAKYDGSKICGFYFTNFRSPSAAYTAMLYLELLPPRGTTIGEPNRYGLVYKLLDIIITQKISTENLFVLGSSVTTEPMHKIGGKRIKKLEELL